MNSGTGHLMSPEAMERLRSLNAELAGGYTEVPERLSRAAKRTLAGRDEAHISLKSGGKLSRWAAHERAKKAKAKRRARSRRAIEKKTRQAQRERR